jgi:putative effector of murein hydrolase LrgA (UPF0299 family)
MKLQRVLLLEACVILAITVLAIFNTRLELYKLDGLIGWLLSGLSYFFLPGHVGAILLTNAADPPDLWGVIVGYFVQGLLIAFIINKLTQAAYSKQ